MIDIKILALEIANNFNEMKLLEIIYTNGEEVLGQVARVPDDPMIVYIEKRIVKVGENSIHKLDYNRLKKVTITYYQKEQKVFE
jgi:hypothetical protein